MRVLPLSAHKAFASPEHNDVCGLRRSAWENSLSGGRMKAINEVTSGREANHHHHRYEPISSLSHAGASALLKQSRLTVSV